MHQTLAFNDLGNKFRVLARANCASAHQPAAARNLRHSGALAQQNAKSFIACPGRFRNGGKEVF
jgi:hypothetical protein